MIRNCRLLAALLVALFALTGCFKSDVPFISEAEADFPFKSITYEYEGEDDQVTLVKVGGAYAAPDEQGDATLLMKSLEDGLILVQAEINDSSKKFYLYSIIKPSADKKAPN